jgi:hypothetical protein
MLSREEKYKAAIETHRHYDNLSMSVVAGMFGVAFACFSLHKEIEKVMVARQLFFVGALAVLVLHLIYRRLSHYATVARDVSTILESKDGVGVSEAYSNLAFTDCRKGKKISISALVSIKSLVLAIAMALCTVLLVSGLSL